MMTWQIKLLFVVVIVFNLIYSVFLPLHPDEAYYWVWSQNLALSYYDHPPLIAYLIKLTTWFSDSVFFIRLVAITCSTLTAYFVYKLALQMFNVRIAEKAVLLFFCTPVTLIAYWVNTPDAPLLLFWILTLYLFYLGLEYNRPHYFYGAGITAGFMLLAKYTGILLFPALLIFLLCSPNYRKQLLNKHIYFAICLTVLIFSPVLIWNYQHDWISFKFQYTHGMGESKIFNPRTLSEFIGSQAGIMNPIFFFATLVYVCKEFKTILRDQKLLYLFIPATFTFLFFTYAACFNKAEANWALPAYLSAGILLAYWWEKFNKKWLFISGIILSLVLMLMVRFPEAFPFLPNKAVLKQQFLGYDKIFAVGSRHIDKDTLVLSDSHQDASEAWYYLKDHPQVYILTPWRFSNYDYWRQRLVGKQFKKVIFFGEMRDRENLQKVCKETKLLDTLHYYSPYVTKTFVVFQCIGLKPVNP